MRLTSIEMKHLGPYQSSSLQFGNHGLHVLYGPNETGKSTLLAAIRGGLFGQARLAEGTVGIRPGSSVRLGLESEQGEVITVDRVLSKKSPPTLHFENGFSETGQSALLEAFPELRGIEQFLFEAFFTVQLADLVSFSEHPQTVSQIFGIRAPLLNPYVFEGKLEKKAREIYLSSARATRPTLNRLLRAYNQVQRKIAQQHDDRAWYEQTEVERDGLETQLLELSEKRRQAEEEREFYRQCLDLEEQVNRLREVENSLIALGDCPTGSYQRWSSAQQLMGERAELKGGIGEAQAEYRRIEENILRLDEHQAWVDVRNTVTRLHSDIQNARQLALALQEATSELARRNDAENQLDFVVPDDWTEEDLQAAAKQSTDWKELFKAAEWREERARQTRSSTDALRAAESVCDARKEAFRAGIGSATGAMDDVDTAADDVRRRKGNLERELNELRDDLRDLERIEEPFQRHNADASGSRTRSTLPVILTAGLLLIGSAIDFAVGFSTAGSLFAIAAVLAFIGWFVGNRRQTRVSREKVNLSSFLDFRHAPIGGETPREMTDRLRNLQTEAKQELDVLVAAERLLGAWQSALEHVRTRETELRTAMELEHEAEDAYASLLQGVHLSDTNLSAPELVNLCRSVASYLTLQKNAEIAKKRVLELQTRLSNVTSNIETTISDHADTLAIRGQQIAQLAVERVACPVEIGSSLEALESLADEWLKTVEKAVADHLEKTKLMMQRDRLASDIKARRDRLDAVIEQTKTIYLELGVDDEHSYQILMERERRRLTLHDERLRLIEDLLVACGGERLAAAVACRVKQTPSQLLHQLLQHADEEHGALSSEMTAVQENIWKLGQALQDSQLDTLGVNQRFEVARLEAAIDDAKASYVSLLLAKSASKWARVNVESSQVLPVFELASNYLTQLTDKRYQSLRIPLGDDGVKHMQVGDSLGHSWPLDVLSRGTRELVYLALRMAVVREYRAKGVVLPVVLDDPLVNFDDARARNVMDLLSSEARVQPMIYLTCHQRFLDVLSNDTGVTMVQLVEDGQRLEETVASPQHVKISREGGE